MNEQEYDAALYEVTRMYFFCCLDFAELHVHHAEGLEPHRRQDFLGRDGGAVQKKCLVREQSSHTGNASRVRNFLFHVCVEEQEEKPLKNLYSFERLD